MGGLLAGLRSLFIGHDSVALVRRRGLCAGIGLAVAGGVFAADAAAQETAPGYPHISGKILVEIQNDGAVSSDDPAARLNDLFNSTEAALALHFNSALSIQSLMVVEPVLDPRPGKDRFFGDHGGFFEELYVQLAFDGLRLFGGKFDAPFGIAWDAAPGIWGVDFAEDYELVERIGGGAEVTLRDMGIGRHTVSAAVFLADRSVLSESILTNRGRTRLSTAGPSNTGDPASFSVALDSQHIPGLAATRFHLGFRHQAPGRGDFGPENGIAVALQHVFKLGETRTLTKIIEGVYLDNADAGPDHRAYITSGGVLRDGPWNLSASYTRRRTDFRGAGDITDHLFQATGGYSFGNGLTIDAGYRFAEEGGLDTHIIGFLLTATIGVGPEGISLAGK